MSEEAPLETALARLGRAQDAAAATKRRRESIEDELFGERDAPPRKIGRFIELGRLGRGGMGEVFRAYDAQLDRTVAIKLLHPDVAERDAGRLEREAQALARVSHPNVVQIYEVGKSSGRTFIAMQLMRGRTLRAWASEEERSWRACVTAYLQAARGLAAIHAKGLVHRDFKPDNAFIDDDGHVRVLDLGLARKAEVEGGGESQAWTETSDEGPSDDAAWELSLTQTGAVLGTPAFMAPEQLDGLPADAHSDQFSFCASLCEAIYGVRPFEGSTRSALRAAMECGATTPRPRSGAVPARVWSVLARGLAVQAGMRWPSVAVLSLQLERLVKPRVRRGWGIAVVAGLTVSGLGVARYAEVGFRCEGSAAQLGGIWDEARAQEIELAFRETALPYADETWSRVRGRLDVYAAAWVDEHTAVCEATRVTQVQTEEEMGLRMGCLRERRTALRATVVVLGQGQVEQAVSLVAGLPELQDCEDVERLRAQRQRVPPPDDFEVARRVQIERDLLADIAALRRAGAYADALSRIDAVVERANVLDYAPLRAEARLSRGWLADDNGHHAQAEQDLRAAHTLAAEVGHDAVVLEASRALAYVIGYRRARHVEGRLWGEMALPLARHSGDTSTLAASLNDLGSVLASAGEYAQAEQRLRRALELRQVPGTEPLEQANSANSLGNVLKSQGKYDEAQRQHRRALALWERALGAEHPQVAVSRGNLGGVLMHQGQLEEAEAQHRRALVIRERAHGRDDPNVAVSLNSLGNVLRARGEYEEAEAHQRRALSIQERAQDPEDLAVAFSVIALGNVLVSQGKHGEAEPHYRRALAIRERVLGPEHPHVAACANNLGNALDAQGRYEESEQQYRRALAIGRSAWGAEHPNLSASLNNLGSALQSQGRFEEAEQQYQRALAIAEQALGAGHPQLAAILGNLGSVLLEQKRFAQAQRRVQRALTIRQSALGAGHPLTIYPRVGLARIGLAQRQWDIARGHAQHAVTVGEAGAVAPELLAEARFVLARALWADPGERARAHGLAEASGKTYHQLGAGYVREAEDVSAWLDDHVP